MFPTQSQQRSMPQAKQDRQVTAILDNLPPSPFFASQFAQTWNYRAQQLNNNGRGDVWHDAQGPHRAFLQGTASEQAVHPQDRTAHFAGVFRKPLLQYGAIQARDLD